MVELEPNGDLWYQDIKHFLKIHKYLEHVSEIQKRTISDWLVIFFEWGNPIHTNLKIELVKMYGC